MSNKIQDIRYETGENDLEDIMLKEDIICGWYLQINDIVLIHPFTTDTTGREASKESITHRVPTSGAEVLGENRANASG